MNNYVSSNLKAENNTLLFNYLYGSLESISQKYGFVTKGNSNNISLYARNTDGILTEWIKFEKTKKEIKSIIVGNTDNLNLWFCETRKDLTPEVLTSFVKDLNDKVFAPLDKICMLSTLIDPEDWQEIAKVTDAHLDERYRISNFTSVYDMEM